MTFPTSEDEICALAELSKLLTPRQILMLAELLRAVMAQGHGEVVLRVDSPRLYMIKTESFSIGKITKPERD